jgi:hypothetical protein
MRVDATIVQLRPRPMFEAADLGVRLVQGCARPLLRCALPVWAAVVVLALSLLPLGAWVPSLVIWLAKPWIDRTLLFVLSRELFRQPTTWADLWAARKDVFWRGLLSSFTLRRLSPWRSYTQPVRQLEGLSGAALRKRRRQILGGHGSSAFGLTGAFAHVEAALVFGLPALLVWLVPGGDMGRAFDWFSGAEPDVRDALLAVAYAIGVAVVEPFYVGAGFAMYLNRRVELEAWDVEQALRHAFPRAA